MNINTHKDSNIETNSTEQAILSAAEAEFMAKGFAGARTTSIAKAADVTHSMLHYYFRTKEALFERIVQSKAAEMGAVVLSALDNETLSFTDKVISVLEKHFDFIKKNPMLPSFLLSVASNVPEMMQVIKRNIRETAAPLVAKTLCQFNEEKEKGEICQLDITALMTDILSLNVVSVAMADPIASVLEMDIEEFLDMRLKENIETIKRRMRP